MQTVQQYIQQNQPVGITGLIRHTFNWVASIFVPPKCEYVNPHYQECENRTVIYCIHGTFDGPVAFSNLVPRLTKAALPSHIQGIRIVRFEGRYQGYGIEYFAKQLRNQIVLNRDTNVILIGHSRGGLIAAYFAEFLAEASGINIHQVHAISAPFQGSTMAVAPFTFFSQSVMQMRVEDRFLRELTERMQHSNNHYFYFAGSDDSLVRPQATCIAGHEDRMRLLNTAHGHLSILTSGQLVELVAQSIVDDPVHPRHR